MLRSLTLVKSDGVQFFSHEFSACSARNVLRRIDFASHS
jgi:hypothetical protein